ncbi:MAG: hypothetical protein WC897_01695 [Candidatus Gracilibacteria bacterium]
MTDSGETVQVKDKSVDTMTVEEIEKEILALGWQLPNNWSQYCEKRKREHLTYIRGEEIEFRRNGGIQLTTEEATRIRATLDEILASRYSNATITHNGAEFTLSIIPEGLSTGFTILNDEPEIVCLGHLPHDKNGILMPIGTIDEFRGYMEAYQPGQKNEDNADRELLRTKIKITRGVIALTQGRRSDPTVH